MCGIAGMLALDGKRPPDPALIDRMTDSLAHRGPDGRGTWHGPGVALGHRRLAILDPEGGAQPWVDDASGAVLSYNGELYNHRWLRNALESKGIRFRSRCDTEVVLQTLLHFGATGALPRFRGMFALALWEPHERRLTLARDGMGVKPLYWAEHDGMVRFGSEIKAILADPDVPRNVHLPALLNYFAHYRLNLDGDTLFDGIREVAPGTFLQWRDGERSETRFWRIPRMTEAEKEDPGEEAVAQRLREELVKAVKIRLMADVPVGAYLSGGIDSAVITAVMNSLTNQPVSTFSIGFPQAGGNEFEFSRPFAESLGVRHQEITLTEDAYFREFEDLIGIKDTPLSVPNEVPLRYLSRFLKKRVTVVLSGEGADELLAGYTGLVRSPHDAILAEQLRGDPAAFDPALRTRLEAELRQIYGEAAFAGQREQFLQLYQWVPRGQRTSWFRAELPVGDAEATIRSSWETVWDRLDSLALDPYEKVLAILQEIHLQALLLRLDATSMAEGVEGRVPYTDRNLVQWVAGLPVKYKLRWRDDAAAAEARTLTAQRAAGRLDFGKYALRLAFAGVVPDEILLRPKTAFPVPLDGWLYGRWQGWLKDRVLTEAMGEWFDLKELESTLAGTRGKQEGMKLWMLANVGIWLDRYFA